MSDRPSPYDAGLGPVSNSPGKLGSSRRRKSLHNVEPCSGLTEIIFWRRIGEGIAPPVDKPVLGLTEEYGVIPAIQSDQRAWYRYPPEYDDGAIKLLAWAEWPEGPTTCEGEE